MGSKQEESGAIQRDFRRRARRGRSMATGRGLAPLAKKEVGALVAAIAQTPTRCGMCFCLVCLVPKRSLGTLLLETLFPEHSPEETEFPASAFPNGVWERGESA